MDPATVSEYIWHCLVISSSPIKSAAKLNKVCDGAQRLAVKLRSTKARYVWGIRGVPR
jgi:hypothetical protein